MATQIVTAVLGAGGAGKYQALCVVPNTATYIVATTAALLSAGGVAGIALEAGSAGNSIAMAVGGAVLALPPASDGVCVSADANGNLLRQAHWDASCFGIVDLDGNVTLVLESAGGGSGGGGGGGGAGQSGRFAYNPQAFGAVPDNAAKSVQNRIALQAMLDFYGVAGTAFGDDVLIDRTYYVSGALYVRFQTNLIYQGPSTGGGGRGRLIFPMGSAGVVLTSIWQNNLQNDSSNTSITNGNNVGEAKSATAGALARNHAYVQGDYVSIPGDTRYVLLATTSGTTGAALAQSATSGTITSVSDTTPIIVTASAPLTCMSGQKVVVSGNAAANGTWRLHRLTSTTFALLGSTAGGTVAGGSFAVSNTLDSADTTNYAAFPQGVVVDGGAATGVTWQFVLISSVKIGIRGNSTTYEVGDVVRIPYDAKSVAICTVPGTTTTSAPAILVDPEYQQFNTLDGTVRWSSENWAHFLILSTNCTLFNCASTLAAGFGALAYGSFTTTPGLYETNANFTVIVGFKAFESGGCVCFWGSDTNGSSVLGANALALGAGQYGCPGTGFEDKSLTGAYWENCYTDQGNGHGYRMASNSGRFSSCFSENFLQSEVTGTPVITSGSPGGPLSWDPQTQSASVQFDLASNGRSQLVAADRRGGVAINTFLDNQSGISFFGFSTSDFEATPYAYKISGTDVGWFPWGQDGYADNPITTSLSGPRATDGAGHLSLVLGHFRGPAASRTYVAYDPAQWTNKAITGGLRRPGDLYARTATPNVGDYSTDVVLAQGRVGIGYGVSDATGWAALPATVTADVQLPTHKFADVWSTSNGALYCSKGGSRGGTAPNPATPVALTTNKAIAWYAGLRVNDRTVVRTPTAQGVNRGYSLDAGHYPAWTSAHAYKAWSIVAAGNGHYFVHSVQKWLASTPFTIGALCTPDVAPSDPVYGNIYQLTAAQVSGTVINDRKGDGAAFTGSSQPTFPNDFVTSVDDGSARWLQIAPKSGATEPRWGELQGTNHTLPSYTEGDFLNGAITWVEVNLITGPSEPTWDTAGAAFADTPTAQYPTDAGFGVWWKQLGGNTAEPDTSWVEAADGTQWTLWDSSPTLAQVGGRAMHAGMKSLAAGTVTRDTAFYELVKFTSGATATYDAAAVIAGATYIVWNATGGALTINPGGLSVPDTEIWRLVSDGTNLYHAQ